MNLDLNNETQLLYALRNRLPKTKEDLDNYLKLFCDVHLASIPIEEGNSCPLDFVWDVVSSATDMITAPHYNILAMSGRGCQKTLSLAVIEELMLQHTDRNIVHMASIREQAYVGYDHFRTIISKKSMEDIFEEPTMRETKVKNKNNNLQICTSSLDSVNSRHASLLLQDELDLTPKVIFDESQGMLVAEKGKMPLNVCISSRKFAIGNVQNILDNQKKYDDLWTIHKWGALEFTKKCLPERNGGEFGVPIYIDNENLEAISQDDYNLIEIGSPQKARYEEYKGYKNCLSCGIFSFCKGNLTKQKEGNPWLQPIDVVKGQFRKEDPAFFKSQRLNHKPSKKGLVYGMYDETIHEKTYGEMWEIFTGSVHPDLEINLAINRPKRFDITLQELISEFVKHRCKCVVGVDFGYSILAACLLAFVDKSGRIYIVDEIARTGLSDAELAHELKKIWGRIPVTKVYADPESPGGKKEIRKATGWSIYEEVDKSRDEGVSTVRRLLRIPGTKETKILINHNCVVLREEIRKYHYKIDPRTNEPTEYIAKKEDHMLDAMRYFIHSMFATKVGSLRLAPTGSDELTTPNKNYVKVPSPMEMAEYLNVPFNDNSIEWELNEKGEWIKKGELDPNARPNRIGTFSI